MIPLAYVRKGHYDEALPDWAELPFALLVLALLIGIIIWGRRGPK